MVFEFLHQAEQVLVSIGPVAAPPVAKNVARHHGGLASDLGQVQLAGSEVMPVTEEIQIFVFQMGTRFQPGFIVENEGLGIIMYSPAFSGHQARIGTDKPTGIVECTESTAQIAGTIRMIAIMPGEAELFHGYFQGGRCETVRVYPAG